VCSLRELKSLVEARPVCLGVPEQLVFLNSAEHASSFSQACLFSWTYITISATVQRLIHNGKQLGRLRQRSRKSQRRHTHQANFCFSQLSRIGFSFCFFNKRGMHESVGCDFDRSSEEQAVDRVVFRMSSPPSTRQETRA